MMKPPFYEVALRYLNAAANSESKGEVTNAWLGAQSLCGVLKESDLEPEAIEYLTLGLRLLLIEAPPNATMVRAMVSDLFLRLMNSYLREPPK